MPYIGNNHIAGDHVNNFKVLDDISSHTATFDGSATSVIDTTNNTIRVPLHRFIQGQRVTYTNGGGGNIGGLTTGTAYFVSFDSANTIKLATTLANANSNTVINLSAVGSGTSHTLNVAFDGVNTKFKMTHGSGKAARLNNATQLNVAINNVIQRPNINAISFTEGFALEDNHKIVFKTAPTVNDIFWGSIIANTIENFDLRDNEVDNFTGNGSTTEFTLSTIPANNESVIVSINGVVQHPSDKNTVRSYSLIESIIEFTAAPALGDEIQVRHIGFAGASTNDVSGFYGRTGNVALTANDHITTGDITARNINASGILTASSANFSGNVSIGGTLTYEDLTNIDSVGIVTARTGIKVLSGGINVIGVSTFQNNVHLLDNDRLQLGGSVGTVDGLQLYHNSSHSYIDDTGTGNLYIQSNHVNIDGGGQEMANFYQGGSVELFHSNIKRLETTATGIKVTGTTAVGSVFLGDFRVKNTNDTNFVTFKPAESLVRWHDNHKAVFGGSNDFQLFHNGTDNFIRTENGSINVTNFGENMAKFIPNGAVELYHDNVKRLETSSVGVSIPQDLDVDGHTNLDNVSIAGVTTCSDKIQMLDNKSIQFGSAAASRTSMYYDGSKTLIRNFNDVLEIGYRNTEIHHTNQVRLSFLNGQNIFSNNASTTFTGSSYHAGWYPSSNAGTFKLNDNARLAFGTNNDTEMYHNNAHFYITNTTGKIRFTGDVRLNNDLDVDGHTNLDNVSIAGVTTFTGGVTSNSSLDLGGELNFTGNGHKYIDVATLNGSNALTIRHQDGSTYETAAYFDANGGAYLQFNGDTKFATTNTGVEVTGKVVANHSNGQVALQPNDGSIEITRTGSGAYIDFKNSTSEDYDARINEEGGHLRVSTHFRLYDDKALELGNRTSSTYGDLRIFHDSSAANNVIEGHTGSLNLRNYNVNSTNIVLSARNHILLQTNLNETAIQCLANGATEIFHDGGATPTLRTTTKGIQVLGEVAAAQDYPNIEPTLDLNFAATKRLDSRFKYARSGRASFINEHGLLEIVNASVPRFDHDPVTRECKGLLIEEPSTNIITYSNAPGMSSPNLGGNPQTNDSVSNITLPTGEKGTVRRYLANAGGGGGRWGGYSGNSGVPKTGSVWVRTVSGTTNAIIDIADGGGKTVSITEEWQRVTTTHTPNNSYEFFDIYFPSPTTIYYWGVQIEESPFMTSYIPTNNATATRGGDTLIVDNIEDEIGYNQNEGTVIMDFSYTQDSDGAQTLFTLSGTSSNATDSSVRQWLRINQSAGTPNTIRYVQNSNDSDSSATVTPGVFQKIAFAYEAGDQDVSLDGTSILDTSRTPNTNIFRLSIGNIGWNLGLQSTCLEGHIKRFTYYPKKLPNSQLNNLTS